MKNLISYIILFCCFIFSKACYPQGCFDKITRIPLYSGSDELVNGRRWVYEKKNNGSPMLLEDSWPKADIIYKGIAYRGIIMNFDVIKNEIIIYNKVKDNEKFVVLNAEGLSGFSFTDTTSDKIHTYIYVQPGKMKVKTLCEYIRIGKVSILINPAKEIKVAIAEESGTYINSYSYFLDVGNGYIRIRSKNKLLKLLNPHKEELSRYIREKKLEITDKTPEAIIDVLKYYESLKQPVDRIT